MFKRTFAALLLTGLFGLSAASASAETFNGQCSFNGRATFAPPYTWIPSYRSYVANGTGTCKGTMDGAAYDGFAAIQIDGRMNAPMSCGVGVATNVPAEMWFGDPQLVSTPRLRLAVANLHTLFTDAFGVLGAYNGYGVGEWVFNVGFGTPAQCAGAGLTELDFVLNIQTLNTLYG